MKFLLLALLPFAVISCSSTGSGPAQGKTPVEFEGEKTFYLTGTPDWKAMADVKKALGSKAKYSGTRVDLGGNRLSGKKLKHPKDSNDENAVGLKIRIPGFHLTNGVVDDIPGGIIVYADNTRFSKLDFTTHGEDYISTPKDKAKGIRIEDCRFYNDRGDKSIQLNDARDAVIKDTLVTGGQTGIRWQESSSKYKDVEGRIENTTFTDVPTAVNAAGYTTITLKGNTYKGVQKQMVKGPHVKLKNL